MDQVSKFNINECANIKDSTTGDWYHPIEIFCSSVDINFTLK